MTCKPAKQPAGRLRYVLPGSNPGLLMDGNINLFKRPNVTVGNGEHASVRSTSFEIRASDMKPPPPAGSPENLEVLMPTVVYERGKWRIVSERQALAHYFRTGQQLGAFDNVAHANSYADRLHKQQARIYCYRNQRQ